MDAARSMMHRVNAMQEFCGRGAAAAAYQVQNAALIAGPNCQPARTEPKRWDGEQQQQQQQQHGKQKQQQQQQQEEPNRF